MSKVKTKLPVSATTRAELRRVAGALAQARRGGSNPTGRGVSFRIDVTTEQTDPVAIEVIEVSADALEQITRLIEEAGAEVAKTPRRSRDELTTQEAADRLGVSRPYLIKLLDAAQIPYRRVGQHRRIRTEDLARFERAEKERRIQVMQELIAETEALGLYS